MFQHCFYSALTRKYIRSCGDRTTKRLVLANVFLNTCFKIVFAVLTSFKFHAIVCIQTLVYIRNNAFSKNKCIILLGGEILKVIKKFGIAGSTIGLVSLFLQPVQAAELEELVVTAKKRQQSLQDVGAAVSAVTGSQLEDGGISNIEDLQSLLPSVSVGSDFAQAKIFIRGIGLNSSFAGVDPSVALHVDGAVVSQSYAQLGSFFDLERVEVLRGPQGTLYGRNATGGSFNLITRKPTEELEGYARVTVGEHSKFLLEGAVGGPLSDSVRGRIAIRSDSRDGYGQNITTGNDIDDADKQSIRGHLDIDLGENANLLLSVEHHEEDDAGLALKFIEVASAVDSGLAAAPGVGGFAPGIRDIASEIDPRNDRSTTAFNAQLNWRFNDNWSLTSITNYRDLDVLLTQDLDISSNLNDDVQNNLVESEHFSQELQLSYESERLRGIVALYHFEEDLFNRNNIGFASADAPIGAFPLFANTQAVLFTGDIDIETTAIFANFNYDLTDKLSLDIGGRYSDETREADNLNRLNFSHFSPFATNRTITFSDKRSFDDFSPSIGLNWRASDDVLFYASYSEGFKSGTIQSGQLTPILDPEEIENIEVGMKGTFFDNRLRLNASAFHYEFTDLQLDRTRSNPDGGFTAIFENAAEAEGTGIEVELSWLPTANFKVDGYIGVLDTEFGEYFTDNPLDAGINLRNLEGNSLRQAPELTWGLRGEYSLPLQSGAMISIAGDLAYKDEQFYTEFNQAITGEDDYTLFNANIKYTSADEKYFINFWGKNLSDEEVYSGLFVIATGRTIGGTLLPPSSVGVTVGYDF